jgi:hypothetical protein
LRALMISIFTAAALIVVPLAGGTAASASIIGRATGNGATLAAAEQNALTRLSELWTGCVQPFVFYNTGQRSDGSWYAYVSANCQGVN